MAIRAHLKPSLFFTLKFLHPLPALESLPKASDGADSRALEALSNSLCWFSLGWPSSMSTFLTVPCQHGDETHSPLLRIKSLVSSQYVAGFTEGAKEADFITATPTI